MCVCKSCVSKLSVSKLCVCVQVAFTQARHQSQPSAISATPATQSDDPCQLCVSKLCVCASRVCASRV